MDNQGYWKSRYKLLTEREKAVRLEKLYRESYKRIEKEIELLYSKLRHGENLSRTELYRFSAFIRFRRELQGISDNLVTELNRELTIQLMKAYKEAGLSAKHFLGKDRTWTSVNRHMAEACINKDWSGSSFSKRNWQNRDELAETIERGVTDCIINGRSKRDLKREIMQRYHASYSRADCLVRTELQHTLNQAQIDTYKSEGVEMLEWLPEPGCCPLCAEMQAENPYPINSLPCTLRHPRCRCTWIPYFND